MVRLRFAWIHLLAARFKSPGPWTVAALSLGLALLPGGEARTQSGGCARCGGVLVGPPAAMGSLFNAFRPPRIERVWREERPAPERRVAGGGYTVCVRSCDGSFFPVAYSGAASRADGLDNVCRSLCPNAVVALYAFPLGGTIDEAVSSTGEPYDSLPNAHKFEHAYDASCSCRAPGQSWAEALARAEAKYGRHSHDIFVTAEIAERLSHPVRGATAKPAQVGQTPGLDANGIDTELSAAAAAMSREGSGIRGEDVQRVARYRLNEGRRVEETGPDGSARRVRVLPLAF